MTRPWGLTYDKNRGWLLLGSLVLYFWVTTSYCSQRLAHWLKEILEWTHQFLRLTLSEEPQVRQLQRRGCLLKIFFVPLIGVQTTFQRFYYRSTQKNVYAQAVLQTRTTRPTWTSFRYLVWLSCIIGLCAIVHGPSAMYVFGLCAIVHGPSAIYVFGLCAIAICYCDDNNEWSSWQAQYSSRCHLVLHVFVYICFELYQCYKQRISRSIIDDLTRAKGPEVKSKLYEWNEQM